jgi:hypothetical protein
MRSAKTDRGSFARAVDTEMKGVNDTLPQDLNRQIFGDGTNTLATTADDTSATCPVDSTKFLEEGMYISFVGTPDGAFSISDTATVSSIDSATQITLNASQTFDTTVPIISESPDTTSCSYRNAMTGIAGLVKDGNIPNMNTVYVGAITRGADDGAIMYWAANKLGNSGTLRNVTIGLLQQGMLKSGTRKFGGNVPTMAVCDADIWATIGNLLVSDKRFRGETMKLDGGWQFLDFSGVPIVWDKDCDANRLYFLDEEHLFFLSQSPLQWMDEDGGILHRVVDYDSYEAVLFTDMELATDRPAAHTVITDLDTNLS